MKPHTRSRCAGLFLALGALAPSAPARQLEFEGRLHLTASPGNWWADSFLRHFDADGDGRRDIAWGGDDTDQSYLGIRLDRGNGGFEQVFAYSTFLFAIPSAIASGDLDGDGVREVVYTTALQHAVVLARNSLGAYVESSQFPIVSSYAALEIGDLDGDGDVDIAGVRDATLRIHWNQGGVISAPVLISIPAGASALSLGDVDGDGHLDAVVASPAAPGTISVIRSLGGGAFAPVATSPAGGLSYALILADLDGDGRPDIATANGSSSTVSVLLNLGSGAFAPAVTSPCGMVADSLDAADADGDGDLDLIVSGTSLTYLEYVGAGSFAAPVFYTTLSTRPAALSDIDGDGDPDLLILGRDVYRNRGDGTFAPDFFGPSVWSDLNLATGDIDGDGDEDLIGQISNGIYVRTNRGDGTLADPAFVLIGAQSAGFLVVDADADGDLDLVVLSTGPTPVRVLVNQGGAFGPPIPISGATGTGYAQVADMNGDAQPDIVTKIGTGFAVAVNAGGATWSAFVTIAGANADSGGWTLADVDGDGDPDLVTSQATALRVHSNLGGLAFASPIEVAPLWAIHAILAADLDADGDIDLVATDAAGTNVIWNQGGTFASPVTLGLPLDRLSAKDLDDDGDLDVLGLRAGSHAGAYENLGAATFGAMSVAGVAGSVALTSIDLDADGDEDLFANSIGRPFLLENRVRTGHAICAGDGSGTACPCGNASTPGAGLGCVNSTGRAARLSAAGSSSLRTDTLRLHGAGMTNSSALYFQGTARVANGAGAVFGDGLRCVAGSVVRLGVRTNVAGASTFPSDTQSPLRVLGQVTVPGERLYQVWFRDAAVFCTPSTWSLTNALRVDWTL